MNSSFNAMNFPHPSSPVGEVAPVQAQASRTARFGAAVWRTLEAVGRARARRELLTLADRWEAGRPELAAQFRAAARD